MTKKKVLVVGVWPCSIPTRSLASTAALALVASSSAVSNLTLSVDETKVLGNERGSKRRQGNSKYQPKKFG